MIKWKLVWSFYLTILIPLLYLLNIIIAFKTPGTINEPVFLILIGTVIGFMGLIFWGLSYFSLGKSFGVLPQKQKRVNKGLYKYFRHPMYIGIYLTFFGLSFANSSWQSLVFLNLIITPILVVRAVFEEKNLIN